MRLFDAMDRADLKENPKFGTNAARMDHNDELQEIVKAWVGSMPRGRVLGILEEFQVVAAAVNDSSDIVQDPHFLERTLVNLSGTILGDALMPGAILHASDNARPVYDGVPAVGEHTRDVLGGELNMSEATLRKLATDGIVSGG